jgi:hypothetical protein
MKNKRLSKRPIAGKLSKRPIAGRLSKNAKILSRSRLIVNKGWTKMK